MKKIICFIVTFALALCMLTACGGEQEAAQPANVVCVIGATNNNPAVDAAEIQELAGVMTAPGSTYTVINAEGNPRVICEGLIEDLSDKGFTDNMMDRIHASQIGGVKAAVAEAAPVTEEVNIAAATGLAVRSIRINETPESKNILVYALSGISTAGVINMSNTPVCKLNIDTSIPAIIETLDLDMSGIEVVFYYCGDVAGAQNPLSPNEQKKLKEFYEELFTGMGAVSVTFMDQLPSGEARNFGQKVSVMMTEDVINQLQENTVKADPADKNTVAGTLEDGKLLAFGEEDIRFEPNTTDLADKDEALEVLAHVVEYMDDHENFELLICGTTTSVGSIEFSEKRANAIRGLLMETGIDGDRVHILGCGCESMLYIPDLNMDGSLNEEIAPLNRSVKMVDYNSEMAQQIADSLN